MNVLRQNTDYALRMMGKLAQHRCDDAISARLLAEEEGVSYQFACKILQQLQGSGLIKSVMGPSGGYRLCREPEQITMGDVVRAMQGNITINRCTAGHNNCPRQSKCGVSSKLCQLQQHVENFLSDVSLSDLL